MLYEELHPINKSSAQEVLASGVPEQLARAVLSVALYEPDLHWAQEYCIQVASHTNPIVRGNAMLGFGHLARINKTALQEQTYMLVLAALSDPEEYVRAQAESAADDIGLFLHHKLRANE
jgi:hypothetical protein